MKTILHSFSIHFKIIHMPNPTSSSNNFICRTKEENTTMAISKLRYTLFTILIVLIILVAIGTIFYFRKEQIGSKPKLIIIAMDGLKFSHIQSDSMPFITEFYKNGVYCPQLQPVFPTNTYPNLFSIATGMLMIKSMN